MKEAADPTIRCEMSSYSARAITVAEAFAAPLFADLCAEYQAEASRNPDLIGSTPNRGAYELLEEKGALHGLGAFCDDLMVGFCAVLVTPSMHCDGNVMASAEAIFVSAGHRAGGAGALLLRAAERAALDAGAKGLYVPAPVGGRLERVLPRTGFREVNRIFYRSLAQ